MKKLGLIINPIAGIGGKLGMKGSDTPEIQSIARSVGAKSESSSRSIEALKHLLKIKDQIEIITYPGEMGENEAILCGFNHRVIGSIKSNQTTGKDSWQAAREMENLGVDLLLFAGGDGTSRNIYDAVGQRITTLGIPTGVKMYSGVFAITPVNAGLLAGLYLKEQLPTVHLGEVMDIDELGISNGLIEAKLYGYLKVPRDPTFLQHVKHGSSKTEKDMVAGIVTEIISSMDEHRLYVMGPGSTIEAIMDQMDLGNTLLGVDAVLNGKLKASDLRETELLKLIHTYPTTVILTVTGGQGYILGRGNQQLSPQVIRHLGRNNLVVVSTKDKLDALHGRPLLVDTGDTTLDKSLNGYWKIVTGYKEYAIHKVGL